MPTTPNSHQEVFEFEFAERIVSDETQACELSGEKNKDHCTHNMMDLLHSISNQIIDGAWGRDPRLRTGSQRLDNLLGALQPGDFVVIGGRPGVGKTSLGLTIAANVARLNNCAVGIFSLEASAKQMAEHLLGSVAKVDMHELVYNPLSFDTDPDRFFCVMSRIGDCLAALDTTMIQIDDTPGLSIVELRHRARQMVAKAAKKNAGRKLGIIVIDYLQLIYASAGASQNRSREQEMAEICKGLKSLAKELGITVIALSQLERPEVQAEYYIDGADDDELPELDREPILLDLPQSRAIDRYADSVLALYRPMCADIAAYAAGDHYARAEALVNAAIISHHIKDYAAAFAVNDDPAEDSTIKLLMLKSRHGGGAAAMFGSISKFGCFTPYVPDF